MKLQEAGNISKVLNLASLPVPCLRYVAKVILCDIITIIFSGHLKKRISGFIEADRKRIFYF